jgi:hypothetical protein
LQVVVEVVETELVVEVLEVTELLQEPLVVEQVLNQK